VVNMNDTKISTGTIVRTVCLVLALVNQVLSATGHSVIPIENEQVETVITTLITVVTSLIAWWKNNSFTLQAREADIVMKNLKEEMKENK